MVATVIVVIAATAATEGSGIEEDASVALAVTCVVSPFVSLLNVGRS